MKKILLSLLILSFLNTSAKNNLEILIDEYTEKYHVAFNAIAHGSDFLLNSYILHRIIKSKFRCSPRMQIVASACMGACLTTGSFVQSYIKVKNNPINPNENKNIKTALCSSSFDIVSKCSITFLTGVVLRLTGILAAHPAILFFGAEGIFLCPPLLGVEAWFIAATKIASPSLYLGLSAATTFTDKRLF